jgi:single-stranded DNA-binding protein
MHYNTEITADRVEFLGSKKETSNAPSGNNFADFPDEDVFTPVDDEDMDLIPF